MRTLRDLLTGGELLHLALLLSLIRLEPRLDLNSRLHNDYQIRNRVNPISQKIIDDLGDLGRFSPHGELEDQRFERLEIAAYMVSALTEGDDQTESGDPLGLYDHEDGLRLPPLVGGQEDLDSGVSDVGQLSDVADTDTETDTDGSRSPETRDPNEGLDDDRPFLSGPYPCPGSPRDELDWYEIETVAQLGSADVGVDGGRREVLDYDNAALMDLDDLDDSKMYQPDEEDVENQLIEIDNRLITLDGSIQNLNDGVRHLGEQLATAQTESDVESFLLGAFDPEESGDDLVSGAVGTDADFPIFNAWEMDVDETLDDMFRSSSEAIVKVDVKEEPEDTYENFVACELVEVKEEIEDGDALENGDHLPSFFDTLVKEEEDSESGSWSFTGASHLEDHSYAAMPYYESSKYESSLDSFGAAARPMESPFSTSSSQFSHRSRETRDERKARQLGVPFSISDIIDSPMEDFNAMMMQTTLTEEQITLCRDIRRRGKNKVAAQNCRRRKLSLISSLEDEVSRARTHKQQLVAERDELYRLRSEWSEKYRHLEEAVLRGLNKDVDSYTLHLPQDGGDVRVVQRHSTRVAKLTRA